MQRIQGRVVNARDKMFVESVIGDVVGGCFGVKVPGDLNTSKCPTNAYQLND